MVEKYSDRADFLFVYSGERGMTAALHHELPEALSAFAEPPDAPVGSQVLLEQRVRAGRKHFDLRMPCLLDSAQGNVQRLYGADPKRLLIVDPTGRIALDSGSIPSRDFPWQEITNWLDHHDQPVSHRTG